MRILHLITRLIFGGAQENTVATCRAQAAAGHEVHLAYGPIYGPEGSLLEPAKATGAVLHEVHAMRRAVLPWFDVVCYRALRKLIRQMQPDVVHTHSSKAGVLGRAAAWAERVPAVIHTVHGLPFHDRQPKLVHHAYVRAERFAARRCHKLIAITQPMVDAMLAQGVGTREQFTVIPSGLDLDAFRLDEHERECLRRQVRRRLGLADDAVVIGLLGRLDPHKGQDDLLDLAPQLAQHWPGVKVLFVGDGFHRPSLAQRVQRERLDDCVVFAGRVDLADVPGYLAAMDVNTLPSHQEGQSRTLIQSLLAGTPVVGYATGGIPEIIREGETGRLAPTGDRAALLHAITETLDNSKAAAATIDAGRRHVERFDERTMVEAIARTYQQVLGADGRCADVID